MSKADRALVIGLVVLGFVAGLVLLVAMWSTSPWGCDSRWDVETEWSITSGCRVMTTEGWVPETNYRVLE